MHIRAGAPTAQGSVVCNGYALLHSAWLIYRAMKWHVIAGVGYSFFGAIFPIAGRLVPCTSRGSVQVHLQQAAYCLCMAMSSSFYCPCTGQLRYGAGAEVILIALCTAHNLTFESKIAAGIKLLFSPH